MLYVERNENGEIVAVLREAARPGMETKHAVDREILDFLGTHAPQDSILHLLASTDVLIIRIVEDLIDLLVRKNLIMLTELPDEAQRKLSSRQKMRQRIGKESILIDEVL